MNQHPLRQNTSEHKLKLTIDMINELQTLKKQRPLPSSRTKPTNRAALQPISKSKVPALNISKTRQAKSPAAYQVDYTHFTKTIANMALSPRGLLMKGNLDPLSPKRDITRHAKEPQSSRALYFGNNSTLEPISPKPRFTDTSSRSAEKKHSFRIKMLTDRSYDESSVYDKLNSLKFSPREVLQTSVLADISDEEKYRELINRYQGAVPAYSKWLNPYGRPVWKKCYVREYNIHTKKFLIEWSDNPEKTKEVYRANLVFEYEGIQTFEIEREDDFNDRMTTFAKNQFERLIVSQLKKREKIEFPREFLGKILQKLSRFLKAEENLNNNTLKLDRCLEEVYEGFRFSETVNEYDAEHNLSRFSVEAIVSKLNPKPRIKKSFTSYDVLYTDDEDEIDKDKEGELVKIIKVHPKSKKTATQSLEFCSVSKISQKLFSTPVLYRAGKTIEIDLEDKEGFQIHRRILLPSLQELQNLVSGCLFPKISSLILKDLSGFYTGFTEILASAQDISEINLFKTAFNHALCKPDEWPDLFSVLYNEVEKFDTKIHKIGKKFEILVYDTILVPNQIKSGDLDKQVINHFVKLLNFYVEDMVKTGVINSLENLKQDLESYTTYFWRENKEKRPEIKDDVSVHQREIFKNVRIFKTKLLERKLIQENSLEIFNTRKIKPLFEINVVVNKPANKKKSLQERGDPVERHNKRMTKRSLLHSVLDGQEKKILLFYLKVKDETCSLEYDDYLQGVKLNSVTKGPIAWAMPNKKCRLNFEPPLEDFESLLMKSLTETFDMLSKAQRISYKEPLETSEMLFKFTGLQNSIEGSMHFVSNFILSSVFEATALLITLEIMRFYFGKIQTYEKDIEDLLKESRFDLVEEELLWIGKDMQVFELLLPNYHQIGLLLVNLKTMKNMFKEVIKKRKDAVIEKCKNHLEKTLDDAATIYNEAAKAMEYHDKDIDEHIKIRLYLQSDEYHQRQVDLQKLIDRSDELNNLLEKALFNFEIDLRLHYYQVKFCSRDLQEMSDDLKKTLEKTKNKYRAQFDEENRLLQVESQKYYNQLKDFGNFDGIVEYFEKRDFSKLDSQGFLKLLVRSKKLNEYRKLLDLSEIDLKSAEELYNLWDYCENFFYTKQHIETDLLESLHLEEVKQIISQGQSVVTQGYAYFTGNEHEEITALLESIEREIERVDSEYKVLSLIMNDCFKAPYKKRMIEVIWADEEKKPEYSNLTFKILKDREIFSYKEDLDILFDEAVYEEKLELDLAIIVESVTGMVLKWDSINCGIFGSIKILANLDDIKQILEIENVSSFPDKFEEVTEKIRNMEILVSLLDYFFQQLSEFQTILIQTSPFWSKRAFLDALAPGLREEISQVVGGFEDDCSDLIKQGIDFLVELCGGLHYKPEDVKNHLLECKGNIDRHFTFKQKLEIISNIEHSIIKFVDKMREESPRLYFLSDSEVMHMLKQEKSIEKLQNFALQCFVNLKDLVITKEDLLRTDTLQVPETPSIESKEKETEVKKKSIYEYYLEGIVTAHDETLFLSRKIPLPKAADKFVNVVEKRSQHLLKVDILKAYRHLNSKSFRLNDMFQLLTNKGITAQTLYLITEAVFYLNLSGLISVMNKPSAKIGATASFNMRVLRSFCEERNKMVKELIKISEDGIAPEFMYFWGKMIQQEKHFIEILEKLINLSYVDEISFEYLSLPKVFIDVPNTKLQFDNILNMIVLYISRIQRSESIVFDASSFLKGNVVLEDIDRNAESLNVNIATFGTRMSYGYEFVNQKDRYYMYPLTDHYTCHMISHIANDSFVALTGTNHDFGLDTTQAIANHLGRLKCVINLEHMNTMSIVLNHIAGTISAGGWLILSKFNCENEFCFSLLAKYLITIREAFLSHQEVMKLDHIPLSLQTDFGLIAIMDGNMPFHGSSISPLVLENFRPKQLQSPNFEYIFKNILYSIGYDNHQQVSQKLTQFLVAISSNERYLKHKFGVAQDTIPFELIRCIAKDLINYAQSDLEMLHENVQDYIFFSIEKYLTNRNWSATFIKEVQSLYDVLVGRDVKFDEPESIEIEENVEELLNESLKMMNQDVTQELKDFIGVLYEGLMKEKAVMIYGEDEYEAWISIRVAAFMHVLTASTIPTLPILLF